MLQRIEHPQDADRDYDFAVTDEQGVAENVTGWTFAFTVWNELAETPAILFEGTNAGGGVVVDVASSGLGRIRVAKSVVGSFSPGRYRFEFTALKGSTPDVLQSGVFILLPKKPTT